MFLKIFAPLAAFFLLSVPAKSENSSVTVSVTVSNSEVGVLASSTVLSPEVNDDGTRATLVGALVGGSGRPIPISISVPTDVDDLGAEGSFDVVAGGVFYSLLENRQLSEFPPVTQLNYFISAERGGSSDTGILSVLDDPHPFLAPAIVGGAYLLICGGLNIYQAQQECTGNRRLVVGIEVQNFTFGCTIECNELVASE